MPTSSASRRMVRASAPSSSRIAKAASMMSRARAERGVPAGLDVGSVGSIGSGVETEDRVQGSPVEQHFVGAVRVDTVEELAHLELPASEVGAQHIDLVHVG